MSDSLRVLCASSGMPSLPMVLQWIGEDEERPGNDDVSTVDALHSTRAALASVMADERRELRDAREAMLITGLDFNATRDTYEGFVLQV